MTSFVDLMKNDVWSPADIKARLHAEIRSEISEFAETELKRVLEGEREGRYTRTPEDQAAIDRFDAVAARVAARGVQARADAALLHETLAVEAAQRRLEQPSPEPEADPAVLAADAEERAAALSAVNSATQPVLDLIALRAGVSE